MISEWFKANREQLLPRVTDWSSPQNKIRYCKNVKKLTFAEWFYLHPSSYGLIHYGSPIVAGVIHTLISTYFFISRHYMIGTFFGVLSIICFVVLYQRMGSPPVKGTTLYDLYMRDY